MYLQLTHNRELLSWQSTFIRWETLVGEIIYLTKFITSTLCAMQCLGGQTRTIETQKSGSL